MSNVLNKPLPKGCLFAALLAFVLFILTFLSAGGTLFLLEIPIHLVSGWVFHARETLPPFLEKWRAAVLPVGCLIIAVWLTHSFICRWAKAKRPDLKWRIKYTVSIFSLLFLSSAAAIAMSGIIHQFFWLSKEDVITRRGGSERARVMMHARNLSQATYGFFNMNQRFPGSFDELKEYFGSDDFCWHSEKGGGVPEPFILIQPRSSDKLEDDELLIVSPLITSLDMYVVSYANKNPIFVSPSEFKIIMAKIKKSENSVDDDQN